MAKNPRMSKWTPTTDALMLRRMGKLTEELGELQSVAARCIIQGIDEVDPGSGKVNRLRLEHEIADVMAQCVVTISALNLNADLIATRQLDKQSQMDEWEALFHPSASDMQSGTSAQLALPSITSNIVNETTWSFIEAMPIRLDGAVLNELKPALHAALAYYHSIYLQAEGKP